MTSYFVINHIVQELQGFENRNTLRIYTVSFTYHYHIIFNFYSQYATFNMTTTRQFIIYKIMSCLAFCFVWVNPYTYMEEHSMFLKDLVSLINPLLYLPIQIYLVPFNSLLYCGYFQVEFVIFIFHQTRRVQVHIDSLFFSYNRFQYNLILELLF